MDILVNLKAFVSWSEMEVEESPVSHGFPIGPLVPKGCGQSTGLPPCPVSVSGEF